MGFDEGDFLVCLENGRKKSGNELVKTICVHFRLICAFTGLI